MKKADLINALADQNPRLTKGDIDKLLASLAETAKAQIAAGNEFIIPGIVTLTPKATAERQGRNPATGVAMTIAAGRTVKAKVAKAVKDAV